MQVVHRLHYDCKLSFNPLGLGKGLFLCCLSRRLDRFIEADIRAFAALMRSACNWSDLRRFRETLSAMERPCSTQQTAEIQQNSQKQASEKAILAWRNYVIHVAMGDFW